MKQLSAWIEKPALGLLLMGALGMIVSMLLGAADVVGTKFFGWPVPGTLEVTESTMVLIVFGALAYTQRMRGHIRVEIFYTDRSPRVRALMDIVTHTVAIVYFGLIGWQGLQEAIYSLQISEATMGTVRFPLFPARALLVAGTALLLLQLLIDVAADIGRMLRGEESLPAAAPQNFQ